MLKSKNTITGKIKSLKEELSQRKSDQKEILLERIRDKEHAEVYNEMLISCEDDINRINAELLAVSGVLSSYEVVEDR